MVIKSSTCCFHVDTWSICIIINAKKMTVFPIMLIFYLVEFTYLERCMHKALV